MPGHDIIAIGASAGGVEALTRLIKGLPPEIPAAIFIVLHLSAHSTSALPMILNRSGSLRASHAVDGEEIQYGRIYIAPPDYHLLVKRGYIHLAHGPKENGHRPAVDALFRTAARYYGRRVVGVVLSGNLDDGTAGLVAVKMRGGVAVVQNPDEALFEGMPRNAIENVEVDYILPLSAIASTLLRLADEPVKEEGADPVTGDMEAESDMAELEVAALQKAERPGKPSVFGCPECGGVLWELHEGEILRFRCRTGHAFSAQSLLAEQSESLETALWTALRALEEKAALARRMFKGACERNQPISAARFEEQAQDAQQNAAIIRELLLRKEFPATEAESGVKSNPESKQNLVLEQREKSVNQNSLANQNANRAAPKELALLETQNSPLLTLVAIASSAGGLKALSELLSALPQNFPAALTIVQHIDRQHPSLLAEILQRRTPLAVKQAEEGDRLCPGSVYVAPSNYHLLVNSDSTISLSKSELVHFVRPSADLLFESVAASFQERAIAVVLTGTGIDGASGVKAIKEMGGTVIVQDQASSAHFGMPGAAIDTGSANFILPLNKIAAALVKLANNG